MAHLSLYRKYRPDNWDKVIGQGHIVTTLINQIKTGTVSHAYLFTGTRGTGKTSSAKIFARAVNCMSPVNGSPCNKCAACAALSDVSAIDIVEMDAASNNGVDEIRELRENVQYPPAAVKYKVYIIDEVHMLSSSAFNALLKTLEEPPAHAIFILATTEVHKLPQTILSRCMRFDFRLVPLETLKNHLATVFKAENYRYDDEALELIAKHGEGSVRDTLSLADMCLSYAPDYLSLSAALEVLGSSDFETLYNLSAALINGDVRRTLEIAGGVSSRGKGVSTVNKELSSYIRDLIAIKNVKNYRAEFNAEQYASAYALAEGVDNYRLGRILDILCGVENSLRYSAQPSIIFEASLVRAAELYTDPSVEGLLSRINTLEKKIKNMEENGIAAVPNVKKETTVIVKEETVSPGIQSETTAVQSATPAVSKKEESSLEAMLAQFATAVTDASPVFESAGNQDTSPLDEYRASEIWGALLTYLREQNYQILYLALQKQQNIKLDKNMLILSVNDPATLGILQSGDNAAILDNAAKEVSHGQYGFSFDNLIKRSEKRREDKIALHDLFGNKFIDKTVK